MLRKPSHGEFRESAGNSGKDKLNADGQGYKPENLGQHVHPGLSQQSNQLRSIAERKIDNQGHGDDGKEKLQPDEMEMVYVLGKKNDGRHRPGSRC